jgi:enoyl-CoA hydratase/carnithine racemase
VRVVPEAALDDEVYALARLLAGRDPRVTRHTKASFNQVEPLGALEAYTFEQMHSEILGRLPSTNRRMRPQADHPFGVDGRKR